MLKKRVHLFLMIMAMMLPLLLCSCSSARKAAGAGGPNLYERVMQSGKLRCAYIVYPPGCIKDPNTGKLSGIGIEALELVAKKLGLTVDIVEEVGWGTMLEGFQTGRYDLVITPLWTNAERAKIVDFSKPLYYSPIFVYVRPGDHRFRDHLEKINSVDVKIAAIDSSTVAVISDADFPKARRLSMPQLTDASQQLLNVAAGKADVTFAEPTLAHLYFQHNPGSLEVLDPVHPIRMFPNCWMFNRGEFEFKAMIDTVLDEVINSGAMDKIINKNLPAPNLVYSVALPYQTPTVSGRAQSKLAHGEEVTDR